ncbi:MAG: response regulator transcription factor [Nitrospirales bacterium]|nr:response regulator transcription factor [Nitrospirales bacterium]
MTKFPRIVLADDHPMVLEGVAKLVEDFGEVVGKVEDGRSLLEVASHLNPDVVIMDISMPSLNGLESARHLQKLVPRCKIIFLTMHADFAYITAAFEAGASGYLLKRSAGSELQLAVKTVLAGRRYVTPFALRGEVSLNVFLGGEKSLFKLLTSRQREVLQLIAEGRSIKDMASLLKISTKTVEFHKAKVMETLGMHSIPELTQFAVAHGLVEK